MDFRLIYRGPLPGDVRGCVEVKHKIRECFSEQLATLLEDRKHPIGNAAYGSKAKVLKGLVLFPLITGDYHMFCELDIQFYRRETPGHLIKKGKEYGGDLDNRIKILFDALRMPSAENEVPGETFKEGEPYRICYCLLEDDSLITKFQIESFTLLEKAATPKNQKDVELIIDVKVKLDQITAKNRDLFQVK